jgi:para-aminobenzoate synthetase / 4-amino-4-deoxychorismate lyase
MQQPADFNPLQQSNSAILYDAQHQQWLLFQQPYQVLTAYTVADILPLLETVQQQVDQGLYAAGFLSYEASPAFDQSFRVQPSSNFPLAWFGLYRKPDRLTLDTTADDSFQLDWTPSISHQHYQSIIHRIKHYIAQGLTYQVNISFRLRSPFSSDPWSYFLQLIQAQEGLYGAFINLDHWTICCASPELFFQWHDGHLLSRPMKGTAPRGLTWEGDRLMAKTLHQSSKNQAENLMIVDMIRNDMGRIADIGSVQVPRLFDVEQYPTLWQMTSPVTCTTKASVAEILQALFPCASITGAPKASTMSIIAELEDSPRHIYTGTIGFITPNRTAQFNVAIRTVLIDKVTQTAEYGVGGGIVWDSVDTHEYDECCTKAQILTQKRPSFDLLESLLWTPTQQYFLLDLHVQRLQNSAHYFAFLVDIEDVHRQLEAIAPTLPSIPHKVRLRLSKQGTVYIDSAPLMPNNSPLQIRLATHPVNSANVFLYHKTTHRTVYKQAYEQTKRSHPNLDDVLLWNERGELTESCTANLVVEWDGQWYTPPISCGLLAGTFRTWLLQQGKLQERVLRVNDLQHCSRIFLINSVRHIQDAVVQYSSP